MRLFVTGGAGFIGANFVRWVLAHQPDVAVTTFDALTYAGNLDSLRDVADDPRYTFVRGDIRDAGAVRDAMAGHDAVVNFAAESHVDRSITAPRTFLDTNVIGAHTVFEAARHLEVPRILHISTDEAYGSIDAPGRAHEDDALRPSSPYAASKASADLLARASRETYGYPVTLSRSSNNFGPYHYPEKVVPLFVTNLIDGEPLPVYGSGQHVRDWTFVEDNCAAQWLILTAGEPGGTYNVGAGNELTNLELAERILAAFGAPPSMIRLVDDRPGHDLRYAVDSTRVRELGWRPAHSFDDALAATIDFYRTHEWWWRPLKRAGATARRGLLDGPNGT
jgi:dTDP-glucose 4,6-dehydratase